VSHEWVIETLLDAVKTDLRGGPDVLTRSQSPEGTRQEIWALFCLYQALADLVGDAARHHRVDPDRISFLRARNTARRCVPRIPADFPLINCDTPVNAPSRNSAAASTTGPAGQAPAPPPDTPTATPPAATGPPPAESNTPSPCTA
jgi:hypothetical protein